MVDLKEALTIFTGTIPLLIILTVNLLDVRGVKEDIRQIRTELIKIRDDIGSIKERLATLEERDRIKLN